jgi:23S rRNA (adenine2030-N6)-methyltransferase
MNYRHIYHAGNVADVAKHAILALVLRHLAAKEKGFAVLDTHAGCGLYDLDDPKALKTGEAEMGIRALHAFLANSGPLPLLDSYLSVLKKLNPLWNGISAGTGNRRVRTYPGSPLLAFHLMRPQDRLIACELHPEDGEALRLAAPADARMQVHKRDGYEAMGAFLPPPEKRGLVLIDPPFEQPDEFAQLAWHITEAWKRWPTGVYMAWYPVKDRPAIWAFHEALVNAGIGKILYAEFIFAEETRSDRLNGGGMVIINPPWKLDEELGALFPSLHKALGTKHQGDTIKWLAD